MSGPSDKSSSSVTKRKTKTKKSKKKKTKMTASYPGSDPENDGYEVKTNPTATENKINFVEYFILNAIYLD